MICLRIPLPPTIANTNIDAKSNIGNSVSEIPNSDDDMQIDNANSTKKRHEDDDRNVQQKEKTRNILLTIILKINLEKLKLHFFIYNPLKIVITYF